MVPSSSYYTIRPEILILQWNKAGMTFLNWNQLWLWNLFAILNVCVLCRWSTSATAAWSPATWVRCSPACTSLLEVESRWFGCSVGSVERAQVRDQPELHFTITESLYNVFVRGLITIAKQMTRKISWYQPVQYVPLPGSVSQFLHQLTQYWKKASSQYSQYAKKVSSQDYLCFIHTSIPDCWLRLRNLRFHLKTSCSRREANKAKAVGVGLRGEAATVPWEGQCLLCLLPEHDLPGKRRKVTMSKA